MISSGTDGLKTSGNIEWLRQIALQFRSAERFAEIENSSVFLRFRKNEVILKQGNKSSVVAYLYKGVVKFNYEGEGEKNIILSIVSAPKILGGANLFYRENNLFSITAVEESDVMLMDSDILLRLLSENGKFAVALFEITSEMFKKSIMNFISLANKQKEGRIADIILFIAENVYHCNSFDLSLTRREISEFACCSQENVIMTLLKWHSENIIRLSKKHLEILSPETLKHISKIG